jgi:hypothetical protein
MKLCASRRLTWLALALVGPVSAQVAETYTLTDITGWTSNQLAALPWFAHWIPLMPPGAPPNFSPAARNGAGAVVGEAAGYYPIPDRGAVVQNGTTTYIAAWGNHPWGYWSCDSHDCHYFWGTVEHSPATDVNAAGLAVGHATIATPFSSSSLDFIEHAYLFDPATGFKTDLTPAGTGYARAFRLNDLGVIIGNYVTASNYLAYRREPDGTMNFFTHPTATVQPMVLNNAGLVAGIHTTYTVSNRIVVPWIASNATTMTPIPLPTQGNPDTCTFTDLNHHGLLVGWANKMATPYDTTAVRWYLQNGAWQAEDLNEVVDAGNYILDRVLAANDAGYLIVAAHFDTPQQEPRTVLLTPDTLPPRRPSLRCRRTSLTPTSAVLRASVNACDNATTVHVPLGIDHRLHGHQPRRWQRHAHRHRADGSSPACSPTSNLIAPTISAFAATNSQGAALAQDVGFHHALRLRDLGGGEIRRGSHERRRCRPVGQSRRRHLE